MFTITLRAPISSAWAVTVISWSMGVGFLKSISSRAVMKRPMTVSSVSSRPRFRWANQAAEAVPWQSKMTAIMPPKRLSGTPPVNCLAGVTWQTHCVPSALGKDCRCIPRSFFGPQPQQCWKRSP